MPPVAVCSCAIGPSSNGSNPFCPRCVPGADLRAELSAPELTEGQPSTDSTRPAQMGPEPERRCVNTALAPSSPASNDAPDRVHASTIEEAQSARCLPMVDDPYWNAVS